MNSIRPLITITILVVAFAFLYVKINESPVQPAADGAKAWEQPADGIPPLATTAETSTTAGTTAPAWPSADTPAPAAPVDVSSSADTTTSAAAPAANDMLPSVAEVTETTSPPVPAMPEMPELATTAQAAPETTTSIPASPDLPANVPAARYPDQPAVNEGNTPVDVSVNAVQPGANVSETVSPITPPATPESVTAESLVAPEPASPLASQPNPLRQTAQPVPGIEPAAPSASATNALSAPTAITAETSFVASWPTIQAALSRGELATAHQLLSRWYDDPSLTPIDAERVDSLLSQLAGTVVYSTDHQLAPAHVVKPGETLESIAKTYNVPWQLLAKINGIPASDQLRPGQEMKVVPGPFAAVVDLTRNQLSLTVDGRYAGKFPVSVPSATAVSEGQWTVDQKLPAPAPAASQTLATSAPVAANPTIVLRSDPMTGQTAGNQTITIASSQSATSTDPNSPAIRVTAQDAAELSDILSIGSRVVIRR